MTIQKLERVMWRLRKRINPHEYCTPIELEVCIMYECGTDPRTIRHTKRALIKLEWLKIGINGDFTLTNRDLNS